ncbi:predicted protein [Naegleria gruberi]|uniref:Predicted protein n=1 Tax=Naegleria gruberi TaxID=5762 RepID=D2VYF2_NAEGR|nr:uncharacterized protein NAEGRDRAFT_74099 [Naegleria gruberi]EFC38229.1 predicted protein [Naegleria gruberi]|eukprot:XP_002670973.1 predicted protein [Naegleria gruberi strain NEG-M]
MKLFVSVLVILLLFIISEVTSYTCNGIPGTDNSTCGGNICYGENSCLCVDLSEKTGLTEQSPILYATKALTSADGKLTLILNDDGSLIQIGLRTMTRYSSTFGPATDGYKLVLTQTGSLKLYDGNTEKADLNQHREAMKTGECASQSPPFKFVLQVDGNMVLYSLEGACLTFPFHGFGKDTFFPPGSLTDYGVLWGGSNCQTPKCNGIVATHPKACPQYTTCVAPNTCQYPTCNGISGDNSTVCSGHGTCTAIDTCKCETNYFGADCQLFNCSDILNTDHNVCSGHGSCVAPNNCSCLSGYSGADCSLFKCYDIAPGNASVCSGHGSCIAPNNCSCTYGYYGSNCSEYECFGTLFTSSSVCSSQGICLSPNNCSCSNDYYGNDCSQFDCFGTASKSASACSVHGTCLSPNNCSCLAGYSGSDCSSFKCFDISPSNSSACSGNGYCIAPNNCSCTSGYYGNECAEFDCFGTASTSGSVCFGHGDCISPNNCSCSNEHYGNDCAEFDCFGAASTSGSVCSSYGRCVSPNNCSCLAGYYGNDCSEFDCYETASTNASACSGHGGCISPNNCSCLDGYYGNDCSQFDCYETASTNASACSGHGGCISPNNCSCLDGYYGNDCSQFDCYGTASTSGSACYGHGGCISPNNCSSCYGKGRCDFFDHCSCQSGYYGSHCAQFTCGGISSNASSVCSGHGQCTDLNICVCDNIAGKGYWTGADCSACVSPYLGAMCNSLVKCNASTTCSGNGYCNELEQCTCYADNKKGFWKGESCSTCADGVYGELCSTKIIGPVLFMDDLTGLTFKVIAPASYSSLYTNSMILDCNKLLKSIDLLGTNPKCYWSNKETFEFSIELNTDYKLKAGDSISLNNLYFESNNVNAQYLAFTVQGALSPKSPIATISGAKDTYGSCEDVLIDASESYSPDRKTLNFKWTVLSSPNKVELQKLLDSTLASPSKLNISYSGMNAGVHQFELAVTSQVYSLVDKIQFSFTKLTYAVPVVSIDGLYKSSSVTVKTSDVPISFKKKLSIPICMESAANIDYTWTQISGPQVEFTVDSFKNLKITNFNTIETRQYVFKVSAFDTSNVNKFSTALVTIDTVAQALSMNMYVLDSTPQYSTIGIDFTDPESENVQPTYSWTCVDTVTNTVCPVDVVNYLSQGFLEQYKIEKSMFGSAENVRISLTIRKGSRFVQSSVDLNFPQQAEHLIMPPLISVVQVSSSKVNKGDYVNIQLVVTINGDLNIDQFISRTWLLNDKAIDAILTSPMSISSSLSNSLILDTQYLDEGSSNTISLTILDKRNNQKTSYSYSFSVNRPPKACSCAISPTSGIALTTIFTFNCENCQNDKKTYAFEYGFIDDFSGALITLSKDEELYQKLPTPNSGNNLELYVKVIDTETSATTLSKKSVQITAPYVSKVKDIKEYMTKWNAITLLLPTGDYARSVFNSAIISRVLKRMTDSLAPKSRSVKKDCSGHGSLVNGKCVCEADYTTFDCRMTKEDYEILNEITQDLATAFFSSQQVKNENGEKITGRFFTNIMFGIESMLKSYVSANVYNMSMNIIKSTLNDAENTPLFQFEVGVERLLLSSLNSMHSYLKTLPSYDYSELMESCHMVVSLLSRKVLVGQSSFKFEPNFAVHQFNKQFKNTFDSQVLTESQTSLTLPSTVSQRLQSVSLRKPVNYIWMIIKDVSQYVTPQQEGTTNTIVSDLSEIKFSTSITNYSSPITHSLPLTQTFNDKATYSCIQVTNGQVIDASSCKFSFNSNSGQCECSENVRVGILSSVPIEKQVNPETPKGISELFWILWAFLIICFIIIAFIVLGIFGYCVVKRMKPETTNSSKQGVEMKSV